MRLAGCLNTLASVLFQQGKYTECEPLLERSLKLRRDKLGAEHVDTADTLRDYAKLLRKLGRNADAELMYAQAKAILAKRPKSAAPAAPNA
ncbi:MAG: tetratricopeptide repeat protein [Candidatus Melainabacteria bacterium]|nr:MAG: tetratricopeptide repeat protein [Candidatus Melainabacteria bacterium]